MHNTSRLQQQQDTIKIQDSNRLRYITGPTICNCNLRYLLKLVYF